MPKQSKGPQKTVHRVMHEYKKGSLNSSQGSKVKKRKQAIAIAFYEAGASQKESPLENKRNYNRTKRREQSAKIGKPTKSPKSSRQGAKSTRSSGRSAASQASR